MRLSADHIVRIAGAWHNASDDDTSTDCRREPRLQSRGTAQVELLYGDHAAPAFGVRIYDVSAGGVGLVMHQPVRKGDRLCVTLPVYEGEDPVRIICVVRYVRMTGERLYRVGAGFQCVAIDEHPAHTQSCSAAD